MAKKKNGIKSQVVEKMTILITSAFGLVAALAWNDAIKQAMTDLGLDVYGPITYAVFVTVLAVVVTVWISKIAERVK